MSHILVSLVAGPCKLQNLVYAILKKLKHLYLVYQVFFRTFDFQWMTKNFVESLWRERKLRKRCKLCHRWQLILYVWPPLPPLKSIFIDDMFTSLHLTLKHISSSLRERTQIRSHCEKRQINEKFSYLDHLKIH